MRNGIENAAGKGIPKETPRAETAESKAGPLIWHAGLDRSSTPELGGTGEKDRIYVVAIAMVGLPSTDDDRFRLDLKQLREARGMPFDQEFHARDLVEETQCEVLEIAQSHNLVAGALLIDKRRTVAEWDPGVSLPKEDELREGATTVLADAFFRRYRLRRLFMDEDVRGEAAKREKTAFYRMHREIWPDTKLHCQHKASNNSDLIQLADIVAYGLSLHARSSIRTTRLERLIKSLWSNPRNVLLGPSPWTPTGFGSADKQE